MLCVDHVVFLEDYQQEGQEAPSRSRLRIEGFRFHFVLSFPFRGGVTDVASCSVGTSWWCLV